MEDSKALEILRTIAPEFKAVSDEEAQKFLDLCAPLVSKSRFGKLYDQALALLAAHRMKLSGLGVSVIGGAAGAGGAAAGVQRARGAAARVNVSFNPANINTGTDSWYALTPYGLEFLNLRRLLIMPITSAGER